MCPKLYRLMRQSVVSAPQIDLTTFPQQFFPSSPNRLGVWFGPIPGKTLNISFSYSTPTAPQFTEAGTTSQSYYGIDKLGSLLFLPIWIWATAATTGQYPIVVVEGLPQAIKEYADDY